MMKLHGNEEAETGLEMSTDKTHFTGEWEVIPTVNEYEGPSPRCGHTMTMHGSISSHQMAALKRQDPSAQVEHGKLLVAFGESSLLSNREYLDDIHLLDLETLRWAKIAGGDLLPEHRPFVKGSINPLARADHAAVSFGPSAGRCLMFGGKCRDTYLDDLIILKNIGGFPSSQNRLKIESIHLPKGPCGRRGSSLCMWKDGSFLLFGGQRGSIFFNDIWGVDLYKQGWVELATRRNPSPRAFHSAFVDSQQQMLLLGGVSDTAANPADADIFKLDLRAGKFFKLGDKDMVPGIANALSKGHHTSHYLDRHCDLVIFAPQKATTFLLGGNVTSEHCGRCRPIHALNEPTEPSPPTEPTTPDDDKSPEKEKEIVRVIDAVPLGTCRPATALLESHRSPANLISVGCGDRVMERLLVFGGYTPAQRICTNALYSLKFASTPCDIKGHTCTFGKTGVDTRAPTPPTKVVEEEGADQLHIPMMSTAAEDEEVENKCMQNVTPMRVSRQSRLAKLRTNKAVNDRREERERARPSTPTTSEDSSLLSDSLRAKSQSIAKSVEPKHRRHRHRRVSIVSTPVRAKQCLTTNVHKFSMFESNLAQRKLHEGLDADLVADCKNKEKMIGNHAQRCEEREHTDSVQRAPLPGRDGRRSRSRSRRSVHWMLIERLLLNFDESMLDTNHPFLLPPHLCIDLVHRALPLIEKDETLTRIEGPVKVFGDIHGQLGDLMSLFKSFGYPVSDESVGDIGYFKYVFLGDFVDRGHKSMEVMCLLLALKIEYPSRVFLIRGNHECHAMNEMYGFYHEINDRLFPDLQYLKYLDGNVINEDYNRKGEAPLVLPEASQSECIDLEWEMDPSTVVDVEEDRYSHNLKRYHTKSRRYFRDRADCLSYLIQSFELLFRWLPLSVLVSEKILCVHGGIGQIETIGEIAAIERPFDVMCDLEQDMDEQQHQVVDLLWSDPAEKDSDCGFKPNKRGVSCVFGSDIVRNFCARNNIDLIIRGHQVVADGFEYFAGGHLITLFSATNYCNVMDNAGAILCIDDKLRVLPKLVEARPIAQEYYEDDEERDYDEEGLEDGAESDDDLQWKKLKQFPASPMRDGQYALPEQDLIASDSESLHEQQQQFGGKISLLFEEEAPEAEHTEETEAEQGS